MVIQRPYIYINFKYCFHTHIKNAFEKIANCCLLDFKHLKILSKIDIKPTDLGIFTRLIYGEKFVHKMSDRKPDWRLTFDDFHLKPSSTSNSAPSSSSMAWSMVSGCFVSAKGPFLYAVISCQRGRWWKFAKFIV